MPTESSEKLRHLKGSLLLGAGVGELGCRTLFPKRTQKGLVSREGLPNRTLVNKTLWQNPTKVRREATRSGFHTVPSLWIIFLPGPPTEIEKSFYKIPSSI